ncbi:hypothetical protein RhiLY_11860 [Ceratobasidium sp. AG-Ba]|nr:hypothetical protein RhiLY_11860 [Ceratobasidium sp. AG-Ba]
MNGCILSLCFFRSRKLELEYSIIQLGPFLSNNYPSITPTTRIGTPSSAPAVPEEPEPSISPGVGSPSNPNAAAPTQQTSFKVIIDSGNCANLGIPQLYDLFSDSSSLIPLNDHQFTVSLTPVIGLRGGAYVFLADNGERCGEFGYYDVNGMAIRAFKRGTTMYPFSVWADGGRHPNGAPADSQTSKYNCWGWSESECPFMFIDQKDLVPAVSTSVPGATIHIAFCPSDGPAVSSIGPSTNTLVVTRSGKGTAGILATETFVPASTFLVPLTTSQSKPRASILFGSVSPIAFVPVPTTLSDSSGMPAITTTVIAVVIPTLSTVTNSQGSTISTASHNLTIPASPSPTPLPETVLTTTSWTTYMTVNGSTVPAIGGRVDVLTTVSETYIFEQNTMVPLSVYSSISAESMRSTQASLPSDTASSGADTTLTQRVSTVVVAVVGSLVGIALVSVLVWVVLAKHRRRQKRTPDYAECHSSMWGSRSAVGSSSRGGLTLDLDGEPEPSESFVEPWTEREEPPQTSRKMQREMVEREGGLTITAPIRGVVAASPSREHAYNGIRPSKSASNVQSGPQLELTVSSSAHAGLSVAQPSQETFNSSPPAVSVPPPLHSAPISATLPVQTSPHILVTRPQYDGERVQDTAIPPRYNEAWNIRVSSPSE